MRTSAMFRWVRCPMCHGDGGWNEYQDIYSRWDDCLYCKSTGRITLWRWFMGEVWFGWLYDKLLYRWYERERA